MKIRLEYEKSGSTAFYQEQGATYRNPHEGKIRESFRAALQQWRNNDDNDNGGVVDVDQLFSDTLDLACGSGEITLMLRALGFPQSTGCDPYCYEAFERRTQMPCLRYSFEQIAQHDAALMEEVASEARGQFSVIVCSYAMHLLDASWLPSLLTALQSLSRWMLIVSPHKRPVITASTGWTQVSHFTSQKVHIKLYRSSSA